jgi:prepilin-type N-terminal cleavage/methylation domain-containing protein
MMNLSLRSRSRKGFTLVELSIVLAVAAMLFAGLWRLMSGSNTQMRDQAAGDQLVQLSTAVKGYLNSTEGQSHVTAIAGATTLSLPLPTAATGCTGAYAFTDFCHFLPAGFVDTTVNSYNQTYRIQIRKDSGEAAGTSPASFSFMIATDGGDTIPDTSGGRIAGMIGNDGGFLYSTDVCGAANSTTACGAYGSWSAVTDATGYNFAPVTALGHIASRTSVIAGADSNIWLARVRYPPAAPIPSEYNTLHTDTYMDGTSSFNLSGSQLNGQATTANTAIQLMESTASPGWLPMLTVGALGSTCRASTGIAYACNNPGLLVNGDAGITGLLNANILYANYFIYNTSDMRLKHDIKPLEHPLEDLSKIRALSFSMNGSNEKKFGVIAQEVKEVYPELIQNLNDGYMGVDYLGLIGPLVGAVQELKANNEALKKQVDEQAKAIRDLQKQSSSKK